MRSLDGLPRLLLQLTHTGVDRTVGYGLQDPSGFKDTYLRRV